MINLSGKLNLNMCVLQEENGDRELFSVYVPTNHIYVGDIFLLGKDDIIRPNLSVREGLGKTPYQTLTHLVCKFLMVARKADAKRVSVQR